MAVQGGMQSEGYQELPARINSCLREAQVFEPPYQNKTFSRAFNGTTVTWQEALQEIHNYMW